MSAVSTSVLESFRIREKNYEGERERLPADCTARIALILSVVVFILFFIQVILLGVYTGFDDISDMAWDVSPPHGKAMTILAIVLGLIMNPIVFIGVAKSSRRISVVGFSIGVFTILFNFTALIILLFAGNGVAVGARDINDSDVNGDVDINSFTNDAQGRIVEYGLENPEIWQNIQNDLNCCGLSIQTLFNSSVAEFAFEDFHTGNRCLLSEADEIVILKGQAGVEEAPQVVDDNINIFPLLNGNTFLCEVPLASELRGEAQIYSIYFGVQSFLTFALQFCLGLLLFSYSESEGGMKADDGGGKARPLAEDTIASRAGLGSGKKGNGAVKIGTNKSRANTVRFK